MSLVFWILWYCKALEPYCFTITWQMGNIEDELGVANLV
jgi:hypothetical protein